MKRYAYLPNTLLLLMSICSCQNRLLAKNNDLISSLQVTQKSISIKINPGFRKKYLTEDFFVTYHDNSINLTDMDYSIVTMPFILNVISIVWISGNTYYIDKMDAQLYDSLETIRTIFQYLYPKTKWDGKLIPQTLTDNKCNLTKHAPTHTALLFSHGLDSICSSFLHADEKQLFLTAYGHYDTPFEQKATWQKVKKKVINFARTYGHTNQFFDSNYHSFLNRTVLDHLSKEIWNWRLQAIEGLGWAGLVAPILVHKGYDQLLIASTFAWDLPYSYAATPLIDDMIQFAGISVKHDAFDLSRTQKCFYLTEKCKELGITKLDVRVCANNTNGENCCKCDKCYRTIIGFLLAGVPLKNFGFSISNYEACIRLKKYISTRTSMHDYVRWIWVDAQQIARNRQVHIADKHVRTFLTWFKKYNLQKIRIHSKHSRIPWKKLTKFHRDIPTYLTT